MVRGGMELNLAEQEIKSVMKNYAIEIQLYIIVFKA